MGGDRVLGVDACQRGWIAVTADGADPAAYFAGNIEPLMARALADGRAAGQMRSTQAPASTGQMRIGRKPVGRRLEPGRRVREVASMRGRYGSLVRAAHAGRAQVWTRGLLCCGVAAGPVFIAVFLLEGVVRDSYRPLRHPVSSLALGPRGWVQTGNFAVAGSLFLAGAAGVARAGDPAVSRAAPPLIGAAGAGLIGAAAFATDPVSGYPPGTPDALTAPSRRGIGHNMAAIPVFFGLPAAALACSRRAWRCSQRGFGLYSAGTAITMLAAMALAAAGFGQSPRLVNLGGLFQRASIIAGFSWLTLLCVRPLRRAPVTHSARSPTA